MNYRNMTNDELVNAAEAARLRNDNPLLTELAARLEAAEAAQVDVLAELEARFPEIRDDKELSGGDAVDRLVEWRYEL